MCELRARSAWLMAATMLVACAGIEQSVAARELHAPTNVLFVGNSFSYYNNSVHNHYLALLRAADGGGAVKGRVRLLAISGGRLAEHRGGLQQMLASQPWDVVILQGHSLEAITKEGSVDFRLAVSDYADQIRAAGARPVLFMTWAYSDDPDMTEQLEFAYGGVGRWLGVEVVPVGSAFAAVTEERPDIALRIDDRRHPSLAGTYLAACTLYGALQEHSPVGLAYTAGLDAEVASYLQQVAWQTLASYRRSRSR